MGAVRFESRILCKEVKRETRVEEGRERKREIRVDEVRERNREVDKKERDVKGGMYLCKREFMVSKH